MSHELGFLPSIPTTICKITIKGPGNYLAEVSWRMMKVVISHPGGLVPPTAGAQHITVADTQRCQVHGLLSCLSSPALALPTGAKTVKVTTGEQTPSTWILLHREVPGPCWDAKPSTCPSRPSGPHSASPHQAVLHLFSSHLLLLLHTFPFLQSLTNSGYAPALCQAQAEP